jgi:hypothetical protein
MGQVKTEPCMVWDESTELRATEVSNGDSEVYEDQSHAKRCESMRKRSTQRTHECAKTRGWACLLDWTPQQESGLGAGAELHETVAR